MFKISLSFFLLGLSFGIGPCLASCGPLLVSYLAGTNKGVAASILAYLLFSLSRIFIYVFLSLAVFLSGELLVKYNLEFISRYSYIVAGVVIIIIGLLVAMGNRYPNIGLCQKLHKFFLIKDSKTVILLGLVIGLLPCAPLISVSSYIGLVSRQWIDSIVYSISFGLGTAVSPLFLLVLSGGIVSRGLINRDKARYILNIICGLIIVFLGIGIIRKGP